MFLKIMIFKEFISVSMRVKIDPQGRTTSRPVLITIFTLSICTLVSPSVRPNFSKSHKAIQISSEISDRFWPRGSLMTHIFSCIILNLPLQSNFKKKNIKRRGNIYLAFKGIEYFRNFNFPIHTSDFMSSSPSSYIHDHILEH